MQEEESSLIEVSHLTKRYGVHTAVEDLTFSIEKGKIYGFLGPNGAGKSTTMNILTGCLAATEGEVRIAGHDIFEEAQEAKKHIGYLPEQPPLYSDMTPEEYLCFVAGAKGVSANEMKEQITRAMTVTGLEPVMGRLIRNLSKGYRQRVGIAQALLGNPDIIILDEPTVGLDPLQIIEIRDLIRALGKDHTVLLSSHILSEVRAVCDVILIISRGKLVACDTPDTLETRFAAGVSVSLTAKCTEEEARAAAEALPGVSVVKSHAEDDRCRLDLSAAGDADTLCEQLFFAFSRMQKPILRLEVTHASLEDVFLELTAGGDPTETAAQATPEKSDEKKEEQAR